MSESFLWNRSDWSENSSALSEFKFWHREFWLEWIRTGLYGNKNRIINCPMVLSANAFWKSFRRNWNFCSNLTDILYRIDMRDLIEIFSHWKLSRVLNAKSKSIEIIHSLILWSPNVFRKFSRMKSNLFSKLIDTLHQFHMPDITELYSHPKLSWVGNDKWKSIRVIHSLYAFIYECFSKIFTHEIKLFLESNRSSTSVWHARLHRDVFWRKPLIRAKW